MSHAGDSPDDLEDRDEDAEPREHGLSLPVGLLFSEVEPVSKQTHRNRFMILTLDIPPAPHNS